MLVLGVFVAGFGSAAFAGMLIVERIVAEIRLGFASYRIVKAPIASSTFLRQRGESFQGSGQDDDG